MKRKKLLRQHRLNVLRLPQKAIALRAATAQGCVSKVENGHLPRPWERQRWADAYEVSLENFEALVKEKGTA